MKQDDLLRGRTYRDKACKNLATSRLAKAWTASLSADLAEFRRIATASFDRDSNAFYNDRALRNFCSVALILLMRGSKAQKEAVQQELLYLAGSVDKRQSNSPIDTSAYLPRSRASTYYAAQVLERAGITYTSYNEHRAQQENSNS